MISVAFGAHYEAVAKECSQDEVRGGILVHNIGNICIRKLAWVQST